MPKLHPRGPSIRWRRALNERITLRLLNFYSLSQANDAR
jgi:hypothetical protein